MIKEVILNFLTGVLAIGLIAGIIYGVGFLLVTFEIASWIFLSLVVIVLCIFSGLVIRS